MLKLTNGHPSDCTSRSSVEVRVYDFLDGAGIPYEYVDCDPEIAACAEIGAMLGAAVCKNLFLCNRKKTDFYLVMILNEKRLDVKTLSHSLNVSRLTFADAESMEKHLGVTPGSVSVMGLMNDAEHAVKLIVDEDVFKAEYFGCHPCVNTTSLRLKTADVFGTFLEKTGHDMLKIRL